MDELAVQATQAENNNQLTDSPIKSMFQETNDKINKKYQVRQEIKTKHNNKK